MRATTSFLPRICATLQSQPRPQRDVLHQMAKTASNSCGEFARRPVPSCATMSRMPPAFMAKTGTPEAIDSSETKLSVSVLEGRAKISAEAKSAASSSPLFQLVKIMPGLPERPYQSAPVRPLSSHHQPSFGMLHPPNA